MTEPPAETPQSPCDPCRPCTQGGNGASKHISKMEMSGKGSLSVEGGGGSWVPDRPWLCSLG